VGDFFLRMSFFGEVEDMDPIEALDPFTGIWIFDPKLSSPAPQSWVQEIHATALEVEVEGENFESPRVEVRRHDPGSF
jgi:hypothetical protein